jgi:hypothetical protein
MVVVRVMVMRAGVRACVRASPAHDLLMSSLVCKLSLSSDHLRQPGQECLERGILIWSASLL